MSSTISKDVNDYTPEILKEIESELRCIPSLRAQWFDGVLATPSNSSYGRWVVKYSPVHFRFFWRKGPAQHFALAFNRIRGSVE